MERHCSKAAKEIRESPKAFEDAITEKQNKLQLLDKYSSAFSNNNVIQLKDLLLRSYNVMAMRETQTQFGEKYVMLLVKRNYFTLFDKPLAVLSITGWGRTPQRNVIVYSNLALAAEMEKKSIKCLREQETRKIQEEKSKMACADPTMSVNSPPVLAKEEMLP